MMRQANCIMGWHPFAVTGLLGRWSRSMDVGRSRSQVGEDPFMLQMDLGSEMSLFGSVKSRLASRCRASSRVSNPRWSI